jgi:hypothetical protein
MGANAGPVKPSGNEHLIAVDPCDWLWGYALSRIRVMTYSFAFKGAKVEP